MSQRISCPVCNRDIALSSINRHLDEGCPEEPNVSETSASGFFTLTKNKASAPSAPSLSANSGRSTINPSLAGGKDWLVSSPASKQSQQSQQKRTFSLPFQGSSHDAKKSDLSGGGTVFTKSFGDDVTADPDTPAAKRQKTNPARSAMPLAERVRPNTLNNIFGQDLVGPDGILRRMIESDSVKSMILWGGPGCGKTTIARTIAASTKARFVELSGTTNNIADCKKIFEQAKSELSLLGRKTILFIDEIHRFTKTQQDVFLAPVESGQVILIGATTESTLKILNRALSTEFPEQSDIPPLLDDKLLTYLAEFASGDARTALNLLEISIQLASQHQTGSNQRFTQEDLKKALTRTLVYDRQGDGHYDTISAFHKSVRGNDPDAALYYLGRMIESGEDPLFISRRMMVMASEDIGLADSTVALCLAKKSTRAYRGLNNVLALLQSDPEAASAPIPLHLRNAPTTLMKTLGYGKEYKYPPNYVDGIVKQEYLPERLIGKKFLEDIDLGTRIDEEAYEEDGAREV
ncbi:hypothetical protein TWF703_009764 [Orbilia oligospora]|uniref:UBZ4-type domain-containing protein n=1 Tax=Orbilia oligospora TaxID=2813651 RepID=A0A7C8JML9_ORBOL|nr:hypothetical protein TWF703_009764 [Orbilia oligospora]